MSSPNAGSASSEYTRRLPDVKKVRAFVAGGASVRPWIEKLRGHDDADYELYQKLAYYLPAVPRALDAYAGMVMNPEPIISDMPDDFQPYIDDMTNDGEPFQRICFRTVEEVTATARYCLLVDYANDPEAPGITRLEAERRGFRPFVRPYRWEDILDWRMGTYNGKRMLSHLRLMEYVDEPDPANEWETKVRKYVRVLDMYSEGGAEPRYRVRIFRETISNNRAETTPGALIEPGMEQIGGDFFPQMNGRPMSYIPAVLFGPNSLDPAILERPPLVEMVEISQSHLNDSALRQWALMWCGQPVPVITGLMDSEDTAELKLGSSQGLVLGEGGSFTLAALGSDGVGAIRDSMEEKRRDMAAIGARILADESGAQISTETARIQRAGEHSVLAGIANTVADGMTQVLRMLAEWAGIAAPDMAVTFNTDFMPRGLQQGELQEWLTQVQMGTLPLGVALEHLKARGVVDPQSTEQDWLDSLSDVMIDRPVPVDDTRADNMGEDDNAEAA
jgi:hypothetical protein